jgi:signal transduction histidine kinase
MEGAVSNLAEVVMLISVLYVRNPLAFLGICIIYSFATPPDGSYFSTLIMHFFPLIFVRFIYVFLSKLNLKSLNFSLIWFVIVFAYFLLMLIPLLVWTNFLFGLNLEKDFIAFYLEIVDSVWIELFATAIVTSLYLMQFILREELKKHNKQLEANVKQRTEDLSKAVEELKTTQKNLVQSEKMASLGTLTAGVAHEINNPLNYIEGAQLALEKYFKEHGSMDKSTTDLIQNSISVGIGRISGIVQGLNQFSRSNEMTDEDCDIHKIIDNCLAMLQHKFKHKIEIEKNYCITQIIIKGNVGKLHQVFINILDNAIQAINANGIIKIHTLIEANISKIIIEDNGCGIEDKYLSKITDPFFTTKDAGKGTGLGLSITYSIIKDHKGNLEFQSEINKYTKVILALPIKQY